LTVTGERVTTPERGFNPTWQRHVAAYTLTAPLLGEGRVLDLGCGVGHSYELLSPRETVGVDLSAEALEGQQRETMVADMRDLPFAGASFSSVLSVHSIEHVPDADRVLFEVARVLEPGGSAIFVTPNRLTFARPDEIIDPYHFVEYDPGQLRELCAAVFAEVRIGGIFGSSRYQELQGEQQAKLTALLAKDPLRLRRLVPRRTRQLLYDRRLTKERLGPDPRADAIGVGDFRLGWDDLESCLDVVAVCRARQ
jgi:SAM-dependent methyltransferase